MSEDLRETAKYSPVVLPRRHPAATALWEHRQYVVSVPPALELKYGNATYRICGPFLALCSSSRHRYSPHPRLAPPPSRPTPSRPTPSRPTSSRPTPSRPTRSLSHACMFLGEAPGAKRQSGGRAPGLHCCQCVRACVRACVGVVNSTCILCSALNYI